MQKYIMLKDQKNYVKFNGNEFYILFISAKNHKKIA